MDSYRRKSMNYTVFCGRHVRVGREEVEKLREELGKKAVAYYPENGIRKCVVCEDECMEGEFSVETILFIPKNKESEMQRFRAKIPRVCCQECASDYAQDKHLSPEAISVKGIVYLWQEFLQSEASAKRCEDMQERDPLENGFLICTQLVKQGGADQGGLHVGDIFVQFGNINKQRFNGLKSIANIVRRSAQKEISVVVWRKLALDDDKQRTAFQKLPLKLKPLQSHDADGGGVLGAVINTYPLPEMKT